MITLSHSKPLRETPRTLVYSHPDDPALLIKILKPYRTEHFAWLKSRRPARLRFGLMKDWAREYEYYISVLARSGSLPTCFPRLYGFSETDVGIGFVVEKIVDETGDLAPTFHEACKLGGEAERLVELVNQFFDDLISCRTIATDLRPSNVVVSGKLERLVLVDGHGEGTMIKLRTYSAYLRKRSLERLRARFLSIMGTRRAG